MSAKKDAAHFSRRDALWLLAGAPSLLPSAIGLAAQRPEKRGYLGKFADNAAHGANAAELAWFQNAKFGLFMHYGLYSQLGHGEWVMLREKVPLAQYEKLKDSFHPDKFDANRIASVAVDAGMKYVTLTSKHHEGFCLFRTRQTTYNSTESPSRRDLVGELAEACAKRRLGLFLYYSAALDWHHPYFPDPSAGFKYFRPAYAKKPAQYLWRKDSDTRIYFEYVHHQVRELLTQYGPIAGMWFDPIMGYYARPDLFPMEDIYRLIRGLQPGCLVSFKQGATGTEDFAAPERHPGEVASYASIAPARREHARETAQKAWNRNRVKPMELCNTLQRTAWGYNRSDNGKHRGPDEVMALLQAAAAAKANLLLNTGPLPDGSIPAEDVNTLLAVGKRRGV